LDTWPLEWYRPGVVGRAEVAIRKQKAKAKRATQQKQNEQHTVEVRTAREAAQTSIVKAPAEMVATEEIHQKVPIESATERRTEGTPSTTTSVPLKWSLLTEQMKPWKKAKESKWDGELTTLTEGDLGDIGDTVREATRDAINDTM